MWELLAIGTTWFWILASVVVMLIIRATEKDYNNYTSNIYLLCFLFLLYFFGNSELFQQAGTYALHHPSLIVCVMLGYIVMGTAWSMVKWYFFLRRVKEELVASKARISWMGKYEVDHNKEKILHWMIYWPISAAWTMMNDPVKRLFSNMLTYFKEFYDNMTEKILGDHIVKPEEHKTREGKLVRDDQGESCSSGCGSA